MRSIFGLVEKEKENSKVALVDEGGEYSFALVYKLAVRVGAYLIDAGYDREPIVVNMPRSAAEVIAFMGVLAAGCFYVPVDEDLGEARISAITKATETRLVLTQALYEEIIGSDVCKDGESKTKPVPTQALYEEIIGLGACRDGESKTQPVPTQALYEEIINTEADDDSEVKVEQRQSAVIDTDPAYIFYTSGSTGVPKGVVGYHRGALDFVEHFIARLHIDADTVFGGQTQLYFEASLKDILSTFAAGATLVIIPKRLFMIPLQLINFINAHGVNTLNWVASALSVLAKTKTFDSARPCSIRLVTSVGEVLSPVVLAYWRKALPEARFYNLYGPTEVTGITCYYEVTRDFAADEPIPIGCVMPNRRVLLLREDGTAIPCTCPGVEGEICITGTCVTLGYYHDEEQTRARFTRLSDGVVDSRMYHTGDIGEYDELGELMFVSRRDFQIKHMGHRIELGDIEAAAMSIPDVTMAACKYDRDRIALYYTGGAGKKEVLAALRQSLPHYMLPGSVEWLSELPMTATGKIDRARLGTV